MNNVREIVTTTELGGWLRRQPKMIAFEHSARTGLRSLIALSGEWGGDFIELAIVRASLCLAVSARPEALESADLARSTKSAFQDMTEWCTDRNSRSIAKALTHAAECFTGNYDDTSESALELNSLIASASGQSNLLQDESGNVLTDELGQGLYQETIGGLGIQAASEDAARFEGKAVLDLFALPLWSVGGSHLEILVDDLLYNFRNHPWSFWREWYQGFLDGKPLDWELQKEIALIPDAEWEKGPERIAELIEEIRADFLSRKLPQAETVEFNADTGKFFVQPKEVAKPDLLGVTLEQVSDALDDALADPSNGLTDRSRETRVLRRTATKYGNNPQRVEMDLTSVHASLTRQIATEELPPSEENLALIKAVEEGAQGIRATDPEVAENRRLLTSRALAELTNDQAQVLAEAQPILEAISEGEMAEDFAEDIPYLLSPEMRAGPPKLGGAERNPILAGYDEKVRTFSRAARIMVLLKKTPTLVHKIDGSAGYKAARILVTLSGLVGIGIALISVL